jgi:hypothetical protein
MNVRNKSAQLGNICMSGLSTAIGSRDHLSWHELYLLALFEPDKTKAVDRIMVAERALVRRERQLFTNPQNSVELEEINLACSKNLYANRQLGLSCIVLRRHSIF